MFRLNQLLVGVNKRWTGFGGMFRLRGGGYVHDTEVGRWVCWGVERCFLLFLFCTHTYPRSASSSPLSPPPPSPSTYPFPRAFCCDKNLSYHLLRLDVSRGTGTVGGKKSHGCLPCSLVLSFASGFFGYDV